MIQFCRCHGCATPLSDGVEKQTGVCSEHLVDLKAAGETA